MTSFLSDLRDSDTFGKFKMNVLMSTLHCYEGFILHILCAFVKGDGLQDK
jgi:hypothetical protein